MIRRRSIVFAAAATVCIGALLSNLRPTPARETNIALHKPVRADSVYDSRYPPENAVDGDHARIESRWLSSRTEAYDWSQAPHWLEIDLLAEHRVVGMRFWSGAHGEYKWPPEDFRLQRLSDGDWIDIISEAGNREPAYATRFPTIATRKIRLLATRGTDIGALRLYEVEILGYPSDAE